MSLRLPLPPKISMDSSDIFVPTLSHSKLIPVTDLEGSSIANWKIADARLVY